MDRLLRVLAVEMVLNGARQAARWPYACTEVLPNRFAMMSYGPNLKA